MRAFPIRSLHECTILGANEGNTVMMKQVRCSVLTLAGLIVATIPPSASTLLVPRTYPTIQDAIDQAQVGDTVLVAPGTYSGPGFRAIDFGGVDLVLRSEAGPAQTILDGGGERYWFAFRFHSFESAAALVDGFTITNYNNEDMSGGAFIIQASSPTIRNCLIAGNHVLGMLFGLGGAAACKEGGSATFVNCTITGNVGTIDVGPRVGGIYCRDVTHVRLERCILRGNQGWDLYDCDALGSVTLYCCAYRPGGLLSEGTLIIEGEQVIEDPRLCNPQPPGQFLADPQDYHLWVDSPCLPWNSPCGELIGAFGIGCPASSTHGLDIEANKVRLSLGRNPICGQLDYAVTLPSSEEIVIDVIDPRGAVVWQLVAGCLPAGRHNLKWRLDPGRVPSGIYYLHLGVVGGASVTKDFVIVR
jgi:hypothetical protein